MAVNPYIAAGADGFHDDTSVHRKLTGSQPPGKPNQRPEPASPGGTAGQNPKPDWKKRAREKVEAGVRHVHYLLGGVGSEEAGGLGIADKNKRLLKQAESNKKHAAKLRADAEKLSGKKKNSKLMRADFYDAWTAELQAEIESKPLPEPIEDTLARIAGEWEERGDTTIAPQEKARRAERTPQEAKQEQIERGRLIARAEMARIRRQRGLLGLGVATLAATAIALRGSSDAPDVPVDLPAKRIVDKTPSPPVVDGLMDLGVEIAPVREPVIVEQPPAAKSHVAALNDEVYTIRVPISDFVSTFSLSTSDTKFPLGLYIRPDLYSDLTIGPGYNEALAPGVIPLIVKEKSQKKEVRVIIEPDGSSFWLDRIFGGVEFVTACSEDTKNARTRHATAQIAALIDAVKQTLVKELSPDTIHSGGTRDPEIIASDIIRRAIIIAGTPDVSNIKDPNELISATTAAPTKDLLRLRNKALKIADLSTHDPNYVPPEQAKFNYVERNLAICENPGSSPMMNRVISAVREIATSIAPSPSLSILK